VTSYLTRRWGCLLAPNLLTDSLYNLGTYLIESTELPRNGQTGSLLWRQVFVVAETRLVCCCIAPDILPS
jgi:hypothetical protein